MITKEDQLAKACADSMWANDDASKGLGMKIEDVRTGYARLSMPIRKEMTNGHDNVHGGFIFALADSTFAFACNGRNQFAVAQHCSITYIAPGKLGDTLTAIATQTSHVGRSGIYDVKVTNQTGDVIAEFRGHSPNHQRPTYP